MILIACVDNSFGLTFNKRRVSKDRIVTERIYEITNGKKLFITSFSQNLFDEKMVIVSNDLLKDAKEGDYAFIEDVIPDDFSGVEKIILFNWNRAYPSDVKFNLPEDFKETTRYEFAGFSHEKITEVEYEK